MSNLAYDGLDDESFFSRVEAKYIDQAPDLSQSLNIAVIGKVSSGKSSLINALLQLSRKQALHHALVGASSGVTKNLTILKLDENVHLIDSPGLDDVRAENSDVTIKFLRHIDIGIFVVTGSSDASQKRNLDDLRQSCDSLFVVLNKIDAWDGLHPSALDAVIDQWKSDLQVDFIYPVCTNGYDPKSLSATMDIRGVSRLRSDMDEFLAKKQKDLLLARHIRDKRPYAIRIIATALAAVTGQVFLPGSAAFITATQAAAITSLYYLHTGKLLSAPAAIAILPTLMAETAGATLFLCVQSFLPPTIVIDMAASGVAIAFTLALLTAINHILSSGKDLESGELLRSLFKSYHAEAKDLIKTLAFSDVRKLSEWSAYVANFVGNR